MMLQQCAAVLSLEDPQSSNTAGCFEQQSAAIAKFLANQRADICLVIQNVYGDEDAESYATTSLLTVYQAHR